MSYIKAAWRAGDVVAGLFLDVSGAFPNASPSGLAHAMRAKGVPNHYVEWMERKLDGRRTTLSFDDYESDMFSIHHGIDQGCPLSCIFYLFYNSALVEVAPPAKRKLAMEMAVGFIDDVALLARGKDMAEASRRVKDMMELKGGALEWAAEFTSDFALEKTALVGFTRKAGQDSDRVEIGERQVPRVVSHRFLGVIFDEQLRWREQKARVLARATKWANLLRRVARMNHGFRPAAAHQLHQAVLLPRITYAADVWYTAPDKGARDAKTRGNAGFTRRLQSVQRISALNITGALRTSPTDALDAHAGIFPSELELRRACHRAAVRMASLLESHPLRQTILKESKGRLAKHNSPLHNLFASTGLEAHNFAPCSPRKLLPKRLRKLHVHVDEAREDAIQREKEEYADVCIYTDGLMKDGWLGAAAVMTRRGKPDRTLKVQLGSDQEHEVYEAEMIGLQLGLHLLLEAQWIDNAAIYTDNQALLKALRVGSTNQLQNMFADLDSLLVQVLARHPGLRINTRWIPGHEGVEGNEKADQATKEAGEGLTSAPDRLPRHLRTRVPTNPTLAVWVHKQLMSVRWARKVHDHPRTERMRAIDPSYPSPQFFQQARELTRLQFATLVQLRLGHFPTASYLYRFHRLESPDCRRCGKRADTVIHLLLACDATVEQRQARAREYGPGSNSLGELLKPSGRTRLVVNYIRDIERSNQR